MVLLNFINLEVINLPWLITSESDTLWNLLANSEAGAFKWLTQSHLACYWQKWEENSIFLTSWDSFLWMLDGLPISGSHLSGKWKPILRDRILLDLGLNPGSALAIAVWPWTGRLLTQNLSVLFYKVGILINLPHSTVMKMKRDYACKVLNIVLAHSKSSPSGSCDCYYCLSFFAGCQVNSYKCMRNLVWGRGRDNWWASFRRGVPEATDGGRDLEGWILMVGGAKDST